MFLFDSNKYNSQLESKKFKWQKKWQQMPEAGIVHGLSG